MVAAQEGIPNDARISDKRYHGARVSVSGARCGDQGRARLARVVQLHQSRGRHGVHGRGGRESQVLADMGDTQAEEEERRPGGTRLDGIWNPLFAVKDAPPSWHSRLCCDQGVLYCTESPWQHTVLCTVCRHVNSKKLKFLLFPIQSTSAFGRFRWLL